VTVLICGVIFGRVSREYIAAADIGLAVTADTDNRTGDGKGFRGPDILAAFVDLIDAIVLNPIRARERANCSRELSGTPGGARLHNTAAVRYN
jgi:hypothetical protein